MGTVPPRDSCSAGTVAFGLIALAAAVAASVARSAAPHCLIVFSRSDGGTNVAVYDTATGRVRDVTFGEGEDLSPAWSPDGNKLAFSRANGTASGDNGHSHIWITDLSGNERRMTGAADDDASPVWSPDGKRIVFSRVHSHGLYVVGVKSRRVTRIATLNQSSTLASWAPNGQTIAYETLTGINSFNLRTRKSVLVVTKGLNPQYLPSGVLAYRSGNTFHAGKHSVTISFAGRGSWNSSATRLVFASAVDEQLTSPPAPNLYVAGLRAARIRHLYVRRFAGYPSWRPSC